MHLVESSMPDGVWRLWSCHVCGKRLFGSAQICPYCNANKVAADGDLVGAATPVVNDEWTCFHCKLPVEAGFDVCWQCGTSRDGTPDPNFEGDARQTHFDPTKCARCKYSLIGLTVNRCPECGEPFPIQQLKHLRPPGM
jgi:hypothetical protein